jgi:type IV pilus assembly protein PilA
MKVPFTKEKEMKQKGFTLIELMVVIVIIGILAGVAIPKMFGMSAKAKASEVAPAVSTFERLQQAYVTEAATVGTNLTVIGWKDPGSRFLSFGTPADGGLTALNGGSYAVSGSAGTLTVGTKAALGADCDADDGDWVSQITATDVVIHRANTTNADCSVLTPTFAQGFAAPI